MLQVHVGLTVQGQWKLFRIVGSPQSALHVASWLQLHLVMRVAVASNGWMHIA